MPLPCIHIGFAKTGTTTLQKHFFAVHPELLNIARPVWRADALAIRDYLRGAGDEAAASRAWRQIAAEAGDAGRTVALSAEGLSEPSLYRGPEDTWPGHRMARLIGEARIVVTIRNQLELIESAYLHHANFSSYAPPRRWLERNRETELAGARYFPVVAHYQAVFGAENVGVFLFEELRARPERFTQGLASFLGVDPAPGVRALAGAHENKRRSARMLAYVRLRSWLLPEVALGGLIPAGLRRRVHRLLARGAPARLDLPESWRRWIADYYRDGNRRLAELTGLALAEHGYPL